MKTWPLQSLTMDQAQHKQFQLVDIICHHFPGSDFLNAGDLGLVQGLNQPLITRRVEAVLADFFTAPAAVLVQGAGTGAIRCGLAAMLKAGESLLIHSAPLYPTTAVIVEQMGLQLIQADYNQLDEVEKAIKLFHPKAALIQHTRQKIDDSYNLVEIISCFNYYGLQSLTDDNYAVMKVENIGWESGATLSTFSCFKLFGPPGVGMIVGDEPTVSKVRQSMYSGGCQVQGFQAMEVLRGLVFAPVMHAVQAQVNNSLVDELNNGAIPEVKHALIANSQSRVILVEFHQPVAEKILNAAHSLGALPYPVGAESKYEIPPLFYRISGTIRLSDPTLEQRMIRINPNRSGAHTVLRILKESCARILNRETC
ncbi:aminotransferase [Salmonella enterica]|nr:aminotransferase [Salmonella enterica]